MRHGYAPPLRRRRRDARQPPPERDATLVRRGEHAHTGMILEDPPSLCIPPHLCVYACLSSVVQGSQSYLEHIFLVLDAKEEKSAQDSRVPAGRGLEENVTPDAGQDIVSTRKKFRNTLPLGLHLRPSTNQHMPRVPPSSAIVRMQTTVPRWSARLVV